MTPHHFAAIAAAGLGIAFCLPAADTGSARAAAGSAQSCFYLSQMEGTKAADARTLYARVSGKGIYRFVMKSDCEGLRPSTERITLEPSPSGQICSPIDVNLHVGDQSVQMRCPVDTITRLTPEEAAALPKAVTP